MSDLISLPMIERLVAFDTTSRNSNMELIVFVRDYLTDLGADCLLIPNDEGTKANLYATLGPRDRGGILLSGHTDVVPVDGQDWDSEPFSLSECRGRLHGRGTADMKSFIAIALAHAPRFLERGLETPVHLALSFDEEVGCIGVRGLIEQLNGFPVRPAMCIVGEPTDMQVVTAHKGKISVRVRVRGSECHSSLAPQGVNAGEYAAEVVASIRAMARRKMAEGPFDDDFDVPHSTVHTGVIQGGTALNIVPAECEFVFEIRHLPDEDPRGLLDELRARAQTDLVPLMRAVDPDAGIDWDLYTEMPGLDTRAEDDVVAFAKALAGRNDHAKVAFGTEAGLFQKRGGIPTVVCGPGSIAQAHKPNEYITREQVAAGEAFMRRLMDKVCSPA